ncbi:TIGD4 [Trypoxylus dichotomus]
MTYRIRISVGGIANADETGLFFKCLPKKTLAIRDDKCYGGKLIKDRVTCLLATNMSGTEKLKPLIIARSAKPRCFKGVKWLPVDYENNVKARMTSEIFEKWLVKLDKQFSHENRKIIMFLDNCPAHPAIQQKLKAIKLQCLPPNGTSKLQPLDQGIIKSFKDHYKGRILKKTLYALENNGSPSISLLDCVREVAMTWHVDVKQKTGWFW